MFRIMDLTAWRMGKISDYLGELMCNWQSRVGKDHVQPGTIHRE